MHQEYQRAVLARSGITSNNGYYFTYTRVTGISDNELSRLKAENPAELVRAHAAGVEGYILFSDTMTRRIFFYNIEDFSFVTALASVLFGGLQHTTTAWLDRYSAGSIAPLDVDQKIKDIYAEEGGQETRNLNYNIDLQWAYELFRPGEPFAARGPHPSGNGVGRYIGLSQLTGEEKEYLVTQDWLSFLNFFSPLLYGIREIPLGNNMARNFALHHYLTSFGADISAHVFLKKAPFNMAFTLHNYSNHQNYFPAIEAELVDFPFSIGNFGLYLSPRVIIGVQPKNQQFKTASAEFLGLFGLRVDFMASKHFLPYLDVALKTDGWAAGNEFLEKNASVKMGLSMRF
jgi:hypothetical protein